MRWADEGSGRSVSRRFECDGTARVGQARAVAERPRAELRAALHPADDLALGQRLGRGESMQAIQDSHPKLAEGYPTARAAYRLAREKNVPTPIMDEVYALLYEGKEPKKAVRDLISRAFKAED